MADAYCNQPLLGTFAIYFHAQPWQAGLVAMAVAPTLLLLIAAQLMVGLSSIGPQTLIPLGAEMVPPAQRHKLIGTLMSGSGSV